MAFRVSGIWSMVGVAMALIALYLILEHVLGATDILGSLFSGAVAGAGVLQGRSVRIGGVTVG
jgi:hypothetical protein